jgi:hypothetical protein
MREYGESKKLSDVCWGVTLLLVLLWMVQPVHAQFDRGQISGFVRDPSGYFVPGADITVVNEATGVTRPTASNESGYYIVPNLSVGYYTVSVELPGFKRFVRTRVNVGANARVAVDATLALGELDETVMVESSAAQVQRDSAQVGKIVEVSDIQNIALSGRNPIMLAMLKPGVVGGAFNTFNPDSLTGGGFSIAGSRSGENLITIDGTIAVRTRSGGDIIGGVNVDTVQEVQVLTANYSAEYGRQAGGQIRFVTKSGGRDFKLNLFHQHRNSALNANTWARNRSNDPDVSSKPAPFRFNQFGYDAGGPIYIPGGFNRNKDKLFFFWAQEWIRWRSEAISFGVVPSMAMREGDFSELLNPANPFFRRVRQVIDPLTGAPFPGNIIPADRQSPNGMAMIRAYPEPVPGFVGTGAQNWFGTSSNPRNTRKDTLKIDFHPSDRHQLTFRGSLYDYKSTDAFRGTFDYARSAWDRPNRTAALAWTWTLSPSLINEFTFAPAADVVKIDVYRDAPYQRSIRGINYPYLFPGVLEKEIPDKIPTIDISNFAVIDGGPYPAFSSGPIYAWSNNTTWIRGTHTFKWGTFLEYSGQNDFDQILVQVIPGGTNNQNGRFEFRDGRVGGTGLAIGNTALGLFNSYGEIGQRAYTAWRATAVDLFAQDSWKVRPNFTLEYGIRYQYWPRHHALWGNIATFSPAHFDHSNPGVVHPQGGYIVSGDPYNGVILPGNGWPDEARGRVSLADNREFDRLFVGAPETGFSKTFKDVISPRLGMAYSINPLTAVRFGVGMFHDRVPTNTATRIGGNPPIQPMEGVSDGIADFPGGEGAVRRQFPLFMLAVDPDRKIPTVFNWNLTVQRQVLADISVEAAYVGRRAYYLSRVRNINQLEPGTLQANPGINPDSLRPFPGMGIVRWNEHTANSWYHGFQLEAERRFTRNLGFGMAYTFSKTTDTSTSFIEVLPNAYDASFMNAISGLHRAHVFNFRYIYDLPFLRTREGALGKALGGWRISGVTFFQSGAPLSAGWRAEDRAGVGPGSGNQPWNISGSPIIPGNQRAFSNSLADSNFWFDPTVFSRADAGTFGNVGRNVVIGPGFQSWDLAIFKDFRVAEQGRLQFRGEIYNLPNHPNWSNPVTDPASGSFGRVQSKSGERAVQFTLRLSLF